MDVESTCMDSYMHGIQWIKFHGHLDYFQKPPLGGRSNTKSGDHGTPNTHNHWFILLYHVWGHAWINIHWNAFGWGPGHIWLHTTLEGLWPHYIVVEVRWGDLWALSFGLSQFHGHGSWLLLQVALTILEHNWILPRIWRNKTDKNSLEEVR